MEVVIEVFIDYFHFCGVLLCIDNSYYAILRLHLFGQVSPHTCMLLAPIYTPPSRK